MVKVLRTDPETGEIFNAPANDDQARVRLVRVERNTEPGVEPVFLRAGAMNGVANYNTDKASVASGIDFTGQLSLTQQQFREEADINTIVRKFGLTGQMPENPRIPSYGDFTQVTDYQTALNAVRGAQEAFDALPAEVRAEFDNDPQKLMVAVADKRNEDRLRELGLLNPKVEVPKPPASGAPSEPIQASAPASEAPAPKPGKS